MNSAVLAKVGALIASGADWPDVLNTLLTDTNVRATGLWRRTGDLLEQLAFRAVSAMSEAVREDFARRTASVQLSSTGLGIVRACLSREIVVVHATDLVGPVDSAIWLRRFGAAVSLSIPISIHGDVAGVLAVALTEPLPSVSPIWGELQTLADLMALRWNAESAVETMKSRIADVPSPE